MAAHLAALKFVDREEKATMQSSLQDDIMDILMLTIPALLVMFATFYLMKKFFEAESRRRKFEIMAGQHKVTVPIRLQAYERLILFLERISINQLILRVYRGGMTSQDLQTTLLGEIRAEYEHNLSQQIYVSHDCWMMVTNAKEEIIKLINLSASHVQPDSSGLELSRSIFDFSVKMQFQPATVAILNLKKEVTEIL